MMNLTHEDLAQRGIAHLFADAIKERGPCLAIPPASAQWVVTKEAAEKFGLEEVTHVLGIPVETADFVSLRDSRTYDDGWRAAMKHAAETLTGMVPT